MNELTAGVSWTAVVVGFALSFLLGWLWYSPRLFGKKWMEGARVTIPEGGGMPVAPLVVQALGTFGLAWIFGITAAGEKLLTVILIVLTLILLVVANSLYAQKNSTAVTIEAGYILAMAVIMFICQALF